MCFVQLLVWLLAHVCNFPSLSLFLYLCASSLTFSSVAILLLVIYYFFAIIGMECLEDKVHPGCCMSVKCTIHTCLCISLTVCLVDIYKCALLPTACLLCTCVLSTVLIIVHCSNASYDVGRYFNGTNVNVYYLNNFDNILRSYGTWCSRGWRFLSSLWLHTLCTQSLLLSLACCLFSSAPFPMCSFPSWFLLSYLFHSDPVHPHGCQ